MAFLGTAVAGWFLELKNNKCIKKIFTIGLVSALVTYGIIMPLKVNCTNAIRLDHQVMELRNVAEILIPVTEEIEIDSSIKVADYMAAVYALKNHAVNLNSDSLSYLQYFQTFTDGDPSRYILFTCDHELPANDEEKVVWNNGKYYIVDRMCN